MVVGAQRAVAVGPNNDPEMDMSADQSEHRSAVAPQGLNDHISWRWPSAPCLLQSCDAVTPLWNGIINIKYYLQGRCRIVVAYHCARSDGTSSHGNDKRKVLLFLQADIPDFAGGRQECQGVV